MRPANCCRRWDCDRSRRASRPAPAAAAPRARRSRNWPNGSSSYVREQMPAWKARYEGVENMTLAVMGCVVNGPGESKVANIGISLPGTGEAPNCPVYIDGQHVTTLTRHATTNWPRRSGGWWTSTWRRSTPTRAVVVGSRR